jgi:hypothetical protein
MKRINGGRMHRQAPLLVASLINQRIVLLCHDPTILLHFYGSFAEMNGGKSPGSFTADVEHIGFERLERTVFLVQIDIRTRLSAKLNI